MQPINYMLDVQNPVQTAMTGLAQGMQIGQFANARELAQKEALQKEQMQQSLAEFAARPNKTADDYASIMAQYPALAEDFQRSYNVLDTGRQQSTFKTASRVYGALHGGNIKVAKSILETEALGYENAGDVDTAARMRELAKMGEENPQGLLTAAGFMLSSANPSQFKEVLGALGENQALPDEIDLKRAQAGKAKEETKWLGPKVKAEIGKIEADTKQTEIENDWMPEEKTWSIENIKSQINDRGERLQLDRDTLETNTQLKLEELGQSNIKLSSGAEKIVNEAVMDSAAALTQSQKLSGLADKFEEEGQAGGWWTSGWAGFRKATGWSNDDQTAMMRDYDRLINGEVLKALPPGPATDKDIEMAQKGFPPANADSTTITSFLRGMAKINEIDSAHKQMVAEWTNQNGQLGSSKRDIEVMGVRVPRGTSFNEFYRANLGRVLESQNSQGRSQQVASGQRSYMNISP
jgi:hypothetical protein